MGPSLDNQEGEGRRPTSGRSRQYRRIWNLLSDNRLWLPLLSGLLLYSCGTRAIGELHEAEEANRAAAEQASKSPWAIEG